MSAAFAHKSCSCPVQYLLVFLGVFNPPENQIQSYYDLKNMEDVKLKASEENVQIAATGSNDIYDYVVFE